MTRARLQIAAVLLVLLMSVATGCGDDDEPERTATTPPAPPVTTAEETETEATDTGAETDGSGAAADLPDPCSLLGEDEMKAATGRDVGSREENGDTVDGFQYRECRWTAVGHTDSAAVRVVSGTRRYDTSLRDLGGAGARITKLDGIGDAAFMASGFSAENAGATGGATIFAKSGGNTFSLALKNAQDKGPPDELESLMRKMISGAD